VSGRSPKRPDRNLHRVLDGSKWRVVFVEWNQASNDCRWAGGQLPTEAEWEKAARGTDGRTYPWGNQAADCNLANYGGCVGSASQLGSYGSGASPYGALDMAGNVREWVSDWYGEGTYRRSPEEDPTGPASGRSQALRGGSWFTYPGGARCANRYWNHPEVTIGNTGFRCVPLPTSSPQVLGAGFWLLGSESCGLSSRGLRAGPISPSSRVLIRPPCSCPGKPWCSGLG
jgi:formylglycine-generating enzyme required for sulfatase activity